MNSQHESEELQKQHDTTALTASLLQVVGHLTEVCLLNNKNPDDAVEMYAKLYDKLVVNWFSAAPLKEEVKKWLDMYFPDYHAYKRPPETEKILP